MAEVLVLGAGPAGLMAALATARRGHRVTVLEAGDRVGGMSASFDVAGVRVDHGSHRLHPATPPDLLALLHELLGPDLQVRPRAGRLRLGGRWVGFPLRAMDLVRSLPPTSSARLAVDAANRSLPLRRHASRGERPSFAEVVEARLGPTVTAELYRPYARKLYGIDADDLDGELAERRVSATSPADVARRLLRARRPAGRTFLYPRRGYGQIADRLAEAATDAGASIRLSTPVTAVEPDTEGVTVTAGGRSHGATTALSTVPLTRLAQLLSPGPPPAVTEALGRSRTRALVLAYLVLDRPRYTPFDAHYVPQLDTPVARLSEPKNYRDGDDPGARTVLCAEIPCWTSDEVWHQPATVVGERVAGDLARLGLPPADPVACEVRRLPSVYPVLDRAGTTDREVIRRWGETAGPVVTLGRQGLRVMDNLHHVLAMGAGAAASLAPDGALDPARWRHQLDTFATHVVED